MRDLCFLQAGLVRVMNYELRIMATKYQPDFVSRKGAKAQISCYFLVLTTHSSLFTFKAVPAL